MYRNAKPNYGYSNQRAYNPNSRRVETNNNNLKIEELKILRARGLISKEEFNQRLNNLIN